MSDPIDLLGVHPSGAAVRRPDPRDYPYSPREVAQASAPFVWPVGSVPDPTIDALLPTKNQGTSGSCGGQAFSYYGQVLRARYANLNAERSAKYLYSQVFVPGGGSDDRALSNIAIKQGFGLEADTTSYDQGQPPLEPFMERPQDITPVARLNAARDQSSIAYAFPLIDIDAVAQAASVCDGIVLGLHGSNNGTWLSQEPKPPSYAPAGVSNMLWSHYMYAHTPQIRNDVKGIWAKQSWGPGVGLNGWQFIDEEYFASGAIWGAIVLIYNPTPDARRSTRFRQT